jgi:hypothetical protein
MLGSSRTLLAFRAGDVGQTPEGARIVAFNMGMTGGGPFTQLLCLRRLLAAGIHPDLLLVEVFPLLLNNAEGHPLEEVWLQSGRMRLSELNRLKSYHSDRLRLLRRWCLARLLPWEGLRSYVQESFLHAGSASEPNADTVPAGSMDAYGWKPHFHDGIGLETRAHMLEVAHSQYRNCMGPFNPCRQPVLAFTSFLDLCEQAHVPMALVLMPEGSQFRSFYSAGLRENLDVLVRGMAQARHIPVHDGSGWLPDHAFSDAHHALPGGADLFTKRLLTEVIAPELKTRWKTTGNERVSHMRR